MTLGRRTVATVAALVVVGFVAVLVASMLRPPQGDTFRAYVAKEAVKVALQLLGLTVVGALVAELVRQAAERIDFARRLRVVYSKAKACRRRLRRLSPEDQRQELEKLEAVQLEFEDLQEEAERRFGTGSPATKGLSSIEKYLNAVIEAGLSPRSSDADLLQDFVAQYDPGSRFAKEFRRPYDAVRNSV